MKESQIRKQSIKPRHVHAEAQLRSLHLNPNKQQHGNICGHMVLMSEGRHSWTGYCIHPFNLYIIKWVHGAVEKAKVSGNP